MLSLSRLTLAAAASLVLFTGVQMRADSPDFSGHWQVNPDKSHFEDEKTISLDIQRQGDQITFTRTYQNDGGKEVTARFTCSTNGKECAFDDGGHKAKVSLWYDGSALVILKTDGDKRDSTVEWNLKMADDGKSMTVNREIMEPANKTEKLALDKSASVAMR